MQRSDYQNLGIAGGGFATNEALARRLLLQPLWSGLGIEVVATEWHRELHVECSECRPAYAAIEIMRTGCFEKRVGRERLIADAGLIVFHRPGEAFEIRHPCGQANRGTTLRIGGETLDELPRRAVFRSQWMATPAPFALALHRLTRRLAAGKSDPLACDEAVVSLMSEALELGAAGSRESPSSPLARSCSRTIQAFLNESFAQPLRLQDVARAAGCSVWHACKEFRAATGSTIHGWLARLRLRHALEALHDGAQDITRVALAAGFSSHSHFTAAFRAEFGMTPAAVRDELAPRS